MISVENLSNYLSKEQIEIDNENIFSIELNFKTKESIFNKYLIENKFDFLNKNIFNIPNKYNKYFNNNFYLLKDNDTSNTFIKSILYIIFPNYRHFNKKSKDKFTRDLFNQMANDLEEKKLYNFFNYNKNHKFNRSSLNEKLHQYENIDQDKLNYVRQYIVDYFNLNIYIFDNEDILVMKYNCKYDNNYEDLDKFNTTIFLIKEDNHYTSIINKDCNGIFNNCINKNIIDNINKFNSNQLVSKKDKKVNYSKMKLSEIQEVALNKGIDIKKEGKQGKMKNRTIKELIELINKKNDLI